MKKKKLAKTLGVIGLTGLGLTALASCQTEMSVNSIQAPLVSYDDSNLQIKPMALTSDVHSFSLENALKYKMSFNKLYPNESLDDESINKMLERYSNLLNTPLLNFADHELSNITHVYIPIYSTQLQKYIAGTFITTTRVNNVKKISQIEYDFNIFDRNINSRTGLADYVAFYKDDIMDDFHIFVDPSTNTVRSKGIDADSDVFFENKELALGQEINLSDLKFVDGVVYDDGAEKAEYAPMEIDGYDMDITDIVTLGFLASGSYTDSDSPALNIPALETNVNNPVTFTEIKQHITATDPTEGDISDRIEFVNNEYVLDSNGKIGVGEYKFTVRVADSSGNVSERDAIIYVKDYDAPTVNATDTRILYNKTLTQSEINALFTYSDNYDSNEDLIVSIDASAYTSASNKLGTYPIKISVTDSSGNKSEATSYVEIYDDIKPTITMPEEMNISNVTPFTLEDLKSKIYAFDDCDGKIDFTITDANKMFPNKKVGSYSFTVEASDSSGNTTIKTMTINVLDGDSAVIDFDMNYFYYVPKSQLLTKENIILSLLSTGRAEGTLENNNIKLMKTEYFLSPHEEGEYDLFIELTDGTVLKDTILVTSDESDKKLNFFEQYLENFKSFATWGWAQWTTLILSAGLILLIGLFCGKKSKKTVRRR